MRDIRRRVALGLAAGRAIDRIEAAYRPTREGRTELLGRAHPITQIHLRGGLER